MDRGIIEGNFRVVGSEPARNMRTSGGLGSDMGGCLSGWFWIGIVSSIVCCVGLLAVTAAFGW